MMRWSDIPFDPPRTTLRQFALLCLLLCGGLACWQLYEEQLLSGLWLLGLALSFGAAAWLQPRVLRPLFVCMIVVSFPVGWLVTHAALALLFYGIFTPLGLLFRVMGRDLLHTRFEPAQDSYWVDKPRAQSLRDYFRQS